MRRAVDEKSDVVRRVTAFHDPDSQARQVEKRSTFFTLLEKLL